MDDVFNISHTHIDLQNIYGKYIYTRYLSISCRHIQSLNELYYGVILFPEYHRLPAEVCFDQTPLI